MSSDLFVSYLRPIDPTGAPADTGVAVQRAAVARYLGRNGRLVGEIVGEACAERPDLNAALGLCHRHGAALLMTELGPWGDDPIFLRSLSRELRRLDLRFVALDRPEASTLTLGIMAAVAEAELRLGVVRTPETMAKRREFYARFTAERRQKALPGTGPLLPVGSVRPLSESRGPATARSRERAEELAPILIEIRAAGAETLEQVANALNALGIPAARGNRWYPMQVTRIEKRLAASG